MKKYNKTNIRICLMSLLLLLFFFVRCSYYNKGDRSVEKSCDTILNNKNFIERKVNIYKVSEVFYTFLDSVIESEKKCSFYNKCTSGFLFSTYKSKNYNRIEINSINIYRYDYSECFGIFEYRDYRFVCENFLIPKLLKLTNNFITVKYMDLDRSNWINVNEDRASTWFFKYKNDSIILQGHHLCY